MDVLCANKRMDMAGLSTFSSMALHEAQLDPECSNLLNGEHRKDFTFLVFEKFSTVQDARESRL